MLTKNKILSIALLLIVLGLLSSCFLHRNSHTADKGKRFPHDDERRGKPR
jgi:hypothetical protein